MRVAGVNPVYVIEIIEELGFRPVIHGRLQGGRIPDITIRDLEDGSPCCPHEYAEVITEIFDRYPHARVRTPITIYADRQDFLRRKGSTLRRALDAYPCDVDHDEEEE